jgi:hypothetical protein
MDALTYERAKREARQATNTLIRRGTLVKDTECMHCGRPRPQTHHRNYRDARDVLFLCQPCHMAEHKRVKRTGRVQLYW